MEMLALYTARSLQLLRSVCLLLLAGASETAATAGAVLLSDAAAVPLPPLGLVSSDAGMRSMAACSFITGQAAT
jgi:hypothetical protein